LQKFVVISRPLLRIEIAKLIEIIHRIRDICGGKAPRLKEMELNEKPPPSIKGN